MTGDDLDLMGEYEAEYLQAVKPEDYYDLIELPNGHHVPVPIAKRLIGQKIVESIPISRKTRGQRFFYCAQCDSLQRTLAHDYPCPLDNPQPPSNPGYSFFRCKTHKPTTKEENLAKESMLLRLILGGLYRTLRYVQAER
jgi:hypothetical protein